MWGRGLVPRDSELYRSHPDNWSVGAYGELIIGGGTAFQSAAKRVFKPNSTSSPPTRSMPARNVACWAATNAAEPAARAADTTIAHLSTGVI